MDCKLDILDGMKNYLKTIEVPGKYWERNNNI